MQTPAPVDDVGWRAFRHLLQRVLVICLRHESVDGHQRQHVRVDTETVQFTASSTTVLNVRQTVTVMSVTCTHRHETCARV